MLEVPRGCLTRAAAVAGLALYALTGALYAVVRVADALGMLYQPDPPNSRIHLHFGGTLPLTAVFPARSAP